MSLRATRTVAGPPVGAQASRLSYVLHKGAAHRSAATGTVHTDQHKNDKSGWKLGTVTFNGHHGPMRSFALWNATKEWFFSAVFQGDTWPYSTITDMADSKDLASASNEEVEDALTKLPFLPPEIKQLLTARLEGDGVWKLGTVTFNGHYGPRKSFAMWNATVDWFFPAVFQGDTWPYSTITDVADSKDLASASNEEVEDALTKLPFLPPEIKQLLTARLASN